MFINPVLFGVLSTIGVECMAVVIVVAIRGYKYLKDKGHNVEIIPSTAPAKKTANRAAKATTAAEK